VVGKIIANGVQPKNSGPEPILGAIRPIEESHAKLGKSGESQPCLKKGFRFPSDVSQAGVQLFLNEKMPL
jgi:hypothetical protein